MLTKNYLPEYLKARVQHFDDERSIGNSIIISLKDGWQFGTDPWEARHVEGFDTLQEAAEGIRAAIPCFCSECNENNPSSFVSAYLSVNSDKKHVIRLDDSNPWHKTLCGRATTKKYFVQKKIGDLEDLKYWFKEGNMIIGCKKCNKKVRGII